MGNGTELEDLRFGDGGNVGVVEVTDNLFACIMDVLG